MGELQSFEPATGALLWSGATGDVDADVARARAAFPAWATHSLAYRTETLRRFATLLRAHAVPFAELIAHEVGQPRWEAELEVEQMRGTVEQAAAAYHSRTPQRVLQGEMRQQLATRHKPHGVAAIITPFCNPGLLPVAKAVPALLAGNTVVLKPSERAPATAAYLGELLHEVGVPEGVFAVSQGDGSVGRALARHRDIDLLMVTGSAQTGLSVHRDTADRVERPVCLEMGGNNPIVAWRPPDLHAAAALIVQSAFLSAAQRCTSARRLIVPAAGSDALLDAVSALTGKLIIGAPFDQPAPYMGPVIDNATADGLHDSFLTLLMAGARPLRHMERPDPDRPFLSPGILDVTDVADRPDIELFGPLLQVVRVPDFEAALAEANNTRFGLSASLIGGTPEMYDRFWTVMRAGNINWNRPTTARSATMPHGGVGLSGNHRYGGSYLADHCAYPVASIEDENPREMLSIGIRHG